MRSHDWHLPHDVWEPRPLPRLMGILNVTPDSFSDGGEHDAPDTAVQHALHLIDDGADIIDVGGESTRPGAQPVDAADEAARVLPVIRELAARTSVPISIDTTKAAVAAAAIEAGASIVNDISGLTFDCDMPRVCANAQVAVVCMHIQGTPQTMQQQPRYTDCVAEVVAFLQQRLTQLADAGIAPERVCLDPGIGFGKTAEHNLELLRNIDALRAAGRPVLIGHSRKRFLAKLLQRPVEERVAGTIGVSVALAQNHADILRVHDVRSVRDALLAWFAIHGQSPDATP